MSSKVISPVTEEKAITEKEAMDIVSKIQGPDGIFAAAEKFKQQIESTKVQKSALEAKLVGYSMIVEILNRLAVHWGIKKLDIPDPIKPTDAAPSGNHVNKETTDRIAKGLCLYKAKKGKKWCSRKLKTKKEKETGYCSVCFTRINSIKENEE